MSDPTPSQGGFSGIDLARSIMPDWAKASHAPQPRPNFSEETEHRERPPRRGPRDNRERPARRDSRPRSEPSGRRFDRSRERDSRDREIIAPPPAIHGWTLSVLADPRGFEGLAKQLKSSAKAYALFDLALVILEKPERYSIRFARTAEESTPLFQCSRDQTLWRSETEAIRHALEKNFEEFYTREQVQTDPPKGAFNCVAVCGMSDSLIGPPNHHSYQTRLRQIHSERFPRVPFESYKSRVRMVRDEAVLERWKQEVSSTSVYRPVATAEEPAEVRLEDMAAVEAHFRRHHSSAIVSPVVSEATLAGHLAVRAPDPSIRAAANAAIAELRRFPLPLAHAVGQSLAASGLQIFKAHQNITYVSIARPKHLDRQSAPVSEGLSAILDFLVANPTMPRPDQWKALVAARGDGGQEAAVASDLSWLIHQGHVVDYARRGLEVVARPQARPPRTQQPATPAAESPAE